MNFWRAPSTTRRSFTRGAAIRSGPTPVNTGRGRAVPLRTTKAWPASSRSPRYRAKYSSTSTRSAASIIRCAPMPRQVIQRRPDRRRLLARVALGLGDKLQHRWRTFPPGANRGVGVDFDNFPRRVRRLLSSSTTFGYSSRNESAPRGVDPVCGRAAGARHSAARTGRDPRPLRGLSGTRGRGLHHPGPGAALGHGPAGGATRHVGAAAHRGETVRRVAAGDRPAYGSPTVAAP